MLDQTPAAAAEEAAERETERRKDSDAAALLLSGMQFAVFERDATNHFVRVNDAPAIPR
jgi:PAS domain-containing protein